MIQYLEGMQFLVGNDEVFSLGTGCPMETWYCGAVQSPPPQVPLVGSSVKSLLYSGWVTLIPDSQQKLSFIGLRWAGLCWGWVGWKASRMQMSEAFSAGAGLCWCQTGNEAMIQGPERSLHEKSPANNLMAPCFVCLQVLSY